MANSTLTPNSREEQDAYDDPSQSRHKLNQAEQQAGGDPYANAGIDQLESFANDPTNAVKQRENIPYENTGESRRSGDSPLSRSSNPITALNRLKKGGPIALIISIILGGGAFMFGSFSLLPIHIYENFLSKFDSNNTSYTIRTNRVITKKLVGDNTSGSCDVVKIACRFKRPSNFMLKNLEANGITAVDKTGAKIDSNGLWPNKRTYKLTFTDSAGNDREVLAPDLKSVLNSRNPADAELTAALHNGLKTRLQTFSDSIFKSVATRFGFSKEDTLANKTSESDITQTIDDETTGKTSEDTTSTGASNGENEDEKNQSTEEIKDSISSEADAESGKLAKSGMGNAVGLAAGGLCLIGDGPGIVIRTSKAFQLPQVIRFGALFMTTASALKAGVATVNEVSTMADALTRTDSNGKSALDSLGIRYPLYGDTSPNDDSGYKNFIPGGAAVAALGAAAVILDGPVKKDICSIATSPVTGAAIDAGLAPETLGLGTLANVAVGALISLGISAIAPTAIKLVLDAIPPPVYMALGEAAFGDITQYIYVNSEQNAGTTAYNPSSQFGDASAAAASSGSDSDKLLGGEGFGDALSSGVANMLGQLANAGGNVPLSVNDAVAYDQQTQAVNLAYAQEDRATHSPFDISNSNTMMGAFFNKLIPLYSTMGSLTSIASSFSGIAASSVSGLLAGNSFAASTADDQQQYEMCTDPALTDANGNKVAAGPFCNIQYGIPPQYLDMDPEQVVNDLVAAGQIDEDTGEPVQGADPYKVTDTIASTLGIPTDSTITDYYDWLQTCTDGKSDQASNCQITDKQTAEYALYTIDHRIQKNVDDEDTAPVTTNNGTVNTTAAVPTSCTNTKPTGSNYADIDTLTGSTFGVKASSAGSKIVALGASTYTFSNFSEQNSGAFISSGGLSGVSTDSSIVQMNANTSSVGSKIPPQSQAPATNQYYLLRLNRPNATLNCVTIKGTDQGHNYNGVMYQQNSNPVLSNAVISNVPGDSNGPPGETFMVNFFGNSGTATIANTTIDGNNIAAAGIGMNSSSATFNINNLVTKNMKYSAGIALWNQTGTVNIHNWTSSNSARSLGSEHLAATVNLYDPNWGPVPSSGHDITLTAYPGHPDGQINFYLTKQPSRKFVIYSDSSVKKSWVHVYMNGTEQTQSNYVTWIGGAQ